MILGKHLASFNLFREPDGSLWVTCSDASGVRDELGASNAPPYLCAMSALYCAVDEMRRAAQAGKSPAPEGDVPEGSAQ